MRESSGLFPNERVLRSYFKRIDSELADEIARRPSDLRLPRKGYRFCTLRATEVDVEIYLRGGEDDDLALPIKIKQGTIPKGEILGLEYEPVPSESTHVNLVPENYAELETNFVNAQYREQQEYMGFGFTVSYLQLDEDFEWLSS